MAEQVSPELAKLRADVEMERRKQFPKKEPSSGWGFGLGDAMKNAANKIKGAVSGGGDEAPPAVGVVGAPANVDAIKNNAAQKKRILDQM